jgi:hypothetical protein
VIACESTRQARLLDEFCLFFGDIDFTLTNVGSSEKLIAARFKSC